MTVTKIIALAKKQKLSKNTRLYIISKNKHYFLNNGTLNEGFSPTLSILKNRDSVLSAFSKLSFLFDEIIRLRIVDYKHDQKSIELLYLLHLIPVNRKIRTFLDWKVFSPEFTQQMSRLFQVKNDTIHCISINEVNYNPKKSHSLASKEGFQIFKKDMINAWKKMVQIYLLEQDKIQWAKLEKEIIKK
ncbi:MAG: hypothetical protein ISR81_07460 [Nitrosopumilus sp.]|nr:hypothetical protein [Nitrosopumilus sp.]